MVDVPTRENLLQLSGVKQYLVGPDDSISMIGVKRYAEGPPLDFSELLDGANYDEKLSEVPKK